MSRSVPILPRAGQHLHVSSYCDPKARDYRIFHQQLARIDHQPIRDANIHRIAHLQAGSSPAVKQSTDLHVIRGIHCRPIRDANLARLSDEQLLALKSDVSNTLQGDYSHFPHMFDACIS